MNINQNKNLSYPQDVTPTTGPRGLRHSEFHALQERFPSGFTVGPMGGAWFAWDHLGNVVGFGNTRKDCVTNTLKSNKPAWYKVGK